MFEKKSDTRVIPTFRCRAEAFDYMFTEMCNRGADLHDAAKRADEFADIIAKNRALPDAPEKQKNMIETCVGYLEQISVIKRDHPEIWNLASGAIGGLIGAFAGSKTQEEDNPQDQPPPPDFDNIQ